MKNAPKSDLGGLERVLGASWVPLGTRFMYPEAAWASWERLGSYFAVWERVLGASQVIWGAS